MTTRRDWAIAVSLIAFVAVWLGFEISRGMFTSSDELFTAERTREMLLLGRDQVHLNFEPSYSKPPLQYWLTSVTLPVARRLGWKQEPAVRVWPLAFGILTAASLLLLARLLNEREEKGLLGLFALAFLVSCPLFTTEISRALLDSGLMFFTTLAIILAQLARKQPRWWIVFAIVAALGTLQKIPLIFLVWIIIIIVRSFSPNERQALRTWWLPAGLVLGVLLSLIWPGLQFFRFHAELNQVFGFDEMANRIHNVAHRTYFEIPLRMSMLWIGAGTIALLAPVFFLYRKERGPLNELSTICLTVTVLAIVFSFRSVRYLTPIIPCFCLLLAFILHWFLEKGRRVRTIAVTTALILFVVGIVEAKVMMNLRQHADNDQMVLAQQVTGFQRDDVHYVLIRKSNDSLVQIPPFYLFYGNLPSSIEAQTTEEFLAHPPGGVIISVSTKADFDAIGEKIPHILAQTQSGTFVCWRLDRH